MVTQQSVFLIEVDSLASTMVTQLTSRITDKVTEAITRNFWAYLDEDDEGQSKLAMKFGKKVVKKTYGSAKTPCSQVLKSSQ